MAAFPKEPPAPDTIVHAPVPTPGSLPARVTVVKPQVDAPVWSAPAAEVVGGAVNEMERVCAALVPQLLLAVTDTLPLVVTKLTTIPVVPCPDVMAAPEGTVQL